MDARVAWRVRYNVPRNDPRYLALTELEALEDLVEVAYHEAAGRRASDPQAVQEELQTQPEALDAMRQMMKNLRKLDWGSIAAKGKGRKPGSATEPLLPVVITGIKG